MIWHATFPQLHAGIAVNVSGRQLLDPAFVSVVNETLARTGLDPHSLTLEITESILAADTGRVIAMLDELRRVGVRIAIDDFGTGYSSFAALSELPVDTLKIDKRFIDKILDDQRGRGLVEAIVRIAQTLELDTIAEGVERSEQQQSLIELGCQHLQGYLFARPMPADDTYAYLEEPHKPTPSRLAGWCGGLEPAWARSQPRRWPNPPMGWRCLDALASGRDRPKPWRRLCATSEMASDGSGGLSGGLSVRSGSHFPRLQRREQPEVVTREGAFAA